MSKPTLDKGVKLARQGQLVGLDQPRVKPVDEFSAEMGKLKRERAERKIKVTTNSSHSYRVQENLLAHCFNPVRPNEMWVSDMTCIPTAEGLLYLASIKEVFTCEIVGYAMGSRMTKELVSVALALAHKRSVAGGIQTEEANTARTITNDSLPWLDGVAQCHAKGTAMTRCRWKASGAH